MTARPAASDGIFYLPELDALRFLAFLTVFVRHSFADSPGFYLERGVPAGLADLCAAVVLASGFGVDLFFLLSSFLITSLLLREQKRTGRIDVPWFYLRRLLRIWPLYFCFVGIVGFLLPRFFASIPGPTGPESIGLLTFTHNWVVAFADHVSLSPTMILWSVSLEEQFYLVWPLLLLVAGVQALRPIAISMIVFSIVAKVCLAALGWNYPYLGFATLLQLEPIAAGALLALARDQIPAFTAGRRAAMLGTGVVIPIVCMLVAPGLVWRNAIAIPLVTVACSLVFLAVLGARSRLLTSGPLLYLGKISYGLYVFHVLLIQLSLNKSMPRIPFGRSIFAFGLTVALAALSYRFLERPFLRLKDRFAHIQSRPA
jgi:peptidoglycan/LPS O-acetylase OafA/YrhL